MAKTKVRQGAPKRRGKGESVLKIIALTLVIVILAGAIGWGIYLGVQTKGYTDWSIFHTQTIPPKVEDEKTPEENVEPGTDDKEQEQPAEGADTEGENPEPETEGEAEQSAD